MVFGVGMLISSQRYARLFKGEIETLRLRALDQERTYGVRSLFASPVRLSGPVGSAVMAVPTPDGWKEEIIEPLPRVYHNLLAWPDAHESRALRDLNGNQNLIVFNETNHWKMRMVYEILFTRLETRHFVPGIVPDSGLYSEPGVYLAMRARGPSDRRVALLQSVDGRNFDYTLPAPRVRGSGSGQDLQATLQSILSSRVLLVRLKDLPVGPDHLPVEWRVYLFRSSETGQFTVAAGLAKRDILRMGSERERCWRLRPALAATFGSEASTLESQVEESGLQVVRALSLFLPGIAQIAVDFWMDPEGRLTLIGLVGCYRTDWMQRSGELQAQRLLADHPVRFARLLSRMGVKLHVDFDRAGSGIRA